MRFITMIILFKHFAFGKLIKPYLKINLQATKNRRNTISLIIMKNVFFFLAASDTGCVECDEC